MKRIKYIECVGVGIKERIKVGPVLIEIRSVLGIAYSFLFSGSAVQNKWLSVVTEIHLLWEVVF